MIKTFYFSLSFLFVCVLYVWFSPFAMIINLIDVSRCGNPSWSSGWWKLCCV